MFVKSISYRCRILKVISKAKVIFLFLVLLAILIASTHEREVPKILQRINKALGLPKISEVLWDILNIENNTNEITHLKERVHQLEDCCNCTTTTTTSGNLFDNSGT